MRTRLAPALLTLAAMALLYCAPIAFAATTVITEFYNTTLGHYVLITSAEEVASIENGAAGPGWQKTGKNFNANTAAADATGLVAVCRFYGSISPGPNSHFFTAEPDECSAVKNDPGWHFEGIAFYVALPADGECANGQVPVWRAYNNGFKPHLGINDGNHRFSVDRPSIQKLVDNGWNDEGVVFCAQADNPAVPVVLGVSSSSLLLLPGASRNVFVTIEPRNGFTGPVTLAVGGLLPGVGHQFTPATVTLGADAVEVVLQLSVAASASPATGVNILTITAATAQAGTAIAGITHRIALPGDPVAVRLAAIAAVEEHCRTLSTQGLTPLAFVQAIAAFLAARPEYEASGTHAETLTAWGRFRDGHVHVITNGYEPAGSQQTVAVASRRGVPVKSNGAELPGATKARLVQSFGPTAIEQRPIDQMRGLLRGKRWTVRPGSDADVGTLKGAVGDGFFYINTHAGRYEVTDPSEGGTMYAIQSATLVDDDYDNIFADDLMQLRLVHQTANNFKPITVFGVAVKQRYDTKYGITYRFVDKYMSFTSDSVVLINACWSGKFSEFRNAFLRKGAAVYLGWSDILDANTVSRSAPYFVDRMLGANQYQADKESPPQRAFPYDLVLQDMDKKSLTTVALTGAKLSATERAGLKYPPIFAPSIKFVRVNEYDEELILDGEFGEDKPTVTLNGKPRAVKSWSALQVTADLPRAGSDASGDVVVEVRGVKSNARQLTEWSIPLQYSWVQAYGIPEFTFVGTGRVRFRADVAGYRTVPGEAPKFAVRGGTPTQDSSLAITATGTHVENDCEIKLAGFGNYVSPSNPARTGPVLATALKIDVETQQGALGIALGHPTAPTTMTFSGPKCSGTNPAPAFLGRLEGDADVPSDQQDNPTIVRLPVARFVLGSDYSIPAKLEVDNAGGGSIELKWPAVPAKSAPRDTADAGK